MSVVCKLFNQSFPPKPEWTIDDIPDLTGKVVIVTGGNTGVGKETCRALLSKNAKVYMASRSKSKADDAIAELKEATGKEAVFLLLDLANLSSIEKSAETFKSLEKNLHILFDNGGVMIPPVEQLTTDGYDLQFGTNVLGHWYFTKLLLPILQSTAKASPDGHTRIVVTASSAAMFASTLDWGVMKDEPERRARGSQFLYAQSKFGNVVVAQELARRYGADGIVTTSLNPGNLKTDLQRHLGSTQRRLLDIMLYPAAMGAVTQLYAGTSPAGAEYNGKVAVAFVVHTHTPVYRRTIPQYLIPWARVGEIPKGADDPALAKRLWEWLEEQVRGRTAPQEENSH
ncbi:hypothetical protein BOTBODRAFT_35039 [Botryobasidium botryosum FD-172 SS1]|uniref:NAD(P)-binding protein n=1 Tax=Botryobasidium botryosum (strain FD-172 SS1) TaxID=930990 RepID=A0A067MAS3_BOTB1|nr:hypothetical protein BOTBODRAFT_35039 [Botryobasidium botryosum FD-172 SS1]